MDPVTLGVIGGGMTLGAVSNYFASKEQAVAAAEAQRRALAAQRAAAELGIGAMTEQTENAQITSGRFLL